jgi:hypothetical protein
MKELSNNELLLYIYKEKDKVILTDLWKQNTKRNINPFEIKGDIS